MTFDILPALDLRDGVVVRLRQGDYARQTVYADNPRALARRYREAGAAWLHVVDLDGARDGGFTQLGLVGDLARSGLKVQAGGGVRTREDVQRLLEAGATRVVVGSLAIREPAMVAEWLDAFGSRCLVLALDARPIGDDWRLASAGWTRDEGTRLEDCVAFYAAHGARHVLCTDIARDGMLSGLNTDLYARLAALAPTLAVQASGGVRGLEDVRGARRAGAAGVVLGRALLDGRFTLAEALSC